MAQNFPFVYFIVQMAVLTEFDRKKFSGNLIPSDLEPGQGERQNVKNIKRNFVLSYNTPCHAPKPPTQPILC